MKTLRAGATAFRFILYPTGEFSATRVKECAHLVPPGTVQGFADALRWSETSYAVGQVSSSLRAEIVASTLGLSKVSNSHKKRKARGRKGMSRYNKRLIVNSCLLLERHYGRKHLSFITLTLPPECANRDSSLYAEAKRQMLQWLQRRLMSSGLSTEVVGCTELQSTRFANTGAFALHEHWVCVGRRPHSSWSIKAQTLQSTWLRILSHVYQVRISPEHSKAACRMESIRRSTGAYVGKYMGKSEAVTKQAIDAGLEGCLPSSWVTRSLSMLKLYRNSILRFNIEKSLELFSILKDNASILTRWNRNIEIEIEPGFNIWIAWIGYLNKDGWKAVGILTD